jgi:transposase
MEDWITIKNLKHRCPELGTRKIAQLLGISRNTVKKALNSDSGPAYQRAAKINPYIEPFTAVIFEMLIVKKFRGSRVLNEIRSKGYQGSQSAFYRYIAKLKKPPKKYCTPYETAPGEQSQFDWSPYTVLIDGQLTQIYVFIYILGFSRYRIYDASLSKTQGSVFEALENGFHETGGVTERIQTDNDKCFVHNASKENFQWNSRYLQFCGHYCIKPTRSLPGHPWSKGKVENPFDYFEDHFITGNTFDSFPHLLEELKKFQYRVNNRVHDTTKTEPEHLFAQEKQRLLPLPDTRYVNIKELVRHVTADCLLSFDGNKYSVPWPFACREVWLRVSKGYFLEIYSAKNELIATHVLQTAKGKIIIDELHYRGHQVERGNWQRLSQLFLVHCPEQHLFLEKLQAQKRINSAYHLTRILDLFAYYQAPDILNAIQACFDYNMFNVTFIQGYLENHCQPQVTVEPASSHVSYDQLNSPIKRNLNEYKISEVSHEPAHH